MTVTRQIRWVPGLPPAKSSPVYNQICNVMPQAPFHDFVENEPKSVVILTYQRCGSTFFGEMFNRNPQVFYTFEPLDALYSALYGTRHEWNVPSDITSFWNGYQRYSNAFAMKLKFKNNTRLTKMQLTSAPMMALCA